MARDSQVVTRLPFKHQDDNVLLDLYTAHWAGTDDGGATVWVSPSLSGEATGYSAGKVELDVNGDLVIRGGL